MVNFYHPFLGLLYADGFSWGGGGGGLLASPPPPPCEGGRGGGGGNKCFGVVLTQELEDLDMLKGGGVFTSFDKKGEGVQKVLPCSVRRRNFIFF